MHTNYSRYLSMPREASVWGAAVTAAGYARIQPRSDYPAAGHPQQHRFTWNAGRTLTSLQFVYIESGNGWFETRRTGLNKIESGTAFVLFPGVWHRFRPDMESGWTENWVEVRGPLVDRLCRTNNPLRTARPVACVHQLVGLEENLNEIHKLMQRDRDGFDAELSALAMRLLAIWINQDKERLDQAPATRVIARAESWLTEHMSEPIEMEQLARRLGMSYSHFRRVFKAHTGMAPWQYLLRLRLSKARQLLINDRLTLADAAFQLGFNSAFHLSSTFKTHYGKSPLHWKRDLNKITDRAPQPPPRRHPGYATASVEMACY